MSLVTILLGLAFLYYYIGVFWVYISSSSEYLGSLELSKLDLSFLAKFFYSFGLRESFYTVAGEGYVKNHMYIYLRLALGIVLFISFLLVIFYRKSHAVYSNAVLVVYFLLFIPAVWGVAFERYFISIYPFILQYGVAIFKRRFF